MLRVFVYGTLKPGERNFERYCARSDVGNEPAVTRGCLYDLPMGYPAMTEGAGWVHGFVLRFEDPAALAALDELEGYVPGRSETENEYYRAEVETYTPEQQSLGPAWVYLMTTEQVQRFGGQMLQGGCWRSC
ncbi:MAG: hypothetical protein AVDCRST_MAG77-2595 [uncultured Chloroflexi bacterium]|uniref:Gamma-glutamylcyclotransferase AIG2-like domain-containing protein n=1 Tax=uncultured Chloroflexota bacterium TaxID=166587 RepID=A0A6J4ISV1_9CHLR|nr:MAG: hypothetical protein AVDCRST_MAG77-2595 [uncultured Chloroflexota bacterium]